MSKGWYAYIKVCVCQKVGLCISRYVCVERLVCVHQSMCDIVYIKVSVTLCTSKYL